MSKIAWIGLGHMGIPMSRNMVQTGHTVRGYDISATACEAAQSNGVEIAESIADAVRDADAVFTMLQSSKSSSRSSPARTALSPTCPKAPW